MYHLTRCFKIIYIYIILIFLFNKKEEHFSKVVEILFVLKLWEQ